MIIDCNLKILDFYIHPQKSSPENELIRIFQNEKIEISEFIEEAENFEYIFTATPVVIKKDLKIKLVSIILLTSNNLKQNKLSIDSIKANTNILYELILISTETDHEVTNYLKSIKEATLIINKDNMGTSFSFNQGLKVANGDYFVFLEGNIVVGECWLTIMLDKFNYFDNLGIVTPLSNLDSGIQTTNNLDYNELTLKDLDDFIVKNQQKNNNLISDTKFVTALCLLCSAELINNIGGFDTTFFLEFFAEDFCLRTIFKGFKIIVSRDVFIHQIKSYEVLKLNYNKIFASEWGIFKYKWDLPQMLELHSQRQIIHPENLENLYVSIIEQPLIKDLNSKLEKKEDLSALKKRIEIHLMKDPENKTSFYCLIYILVIEKNYNDALNIIEKLLKIEHLNKDLCHLMSLVMGNLGQKTISENFKLKGEQIGNVSVLNNILTQFPFPQ